MDTLSRTENKEIMRQARQCLSGNWGLAIGVTFVYSAVWGVLGFIPFGQLISFIIAGPLFLGLNIFFLTLSRNQDTAFDQLFQGFNRFGTSFLAYLLMTIFIFLWSLLLIIPGIIASYAYALTFFILADDPTINAADAISKSKELMRGNKLKLFCLHFRFIGWIILCVLTLGLGFFFLAPYINASMAHFYNDVIANCQESEMLPSPEEDQDDNLNETF